MLKCIHWSATNEILLTRVCTLILCLIGKDKYFQYSVLYIQNRIYTLRTVNIVLHNYHFIISLFYTFPRDDSCFFFGGRLKEWIDGGTAVVTASKTTYGNSVRLEIEAILPVSAVVVWKVDSVVIEG